MCVDFNCYSENIETEEEDVEDSIYIEKDCTFMLSHSVYTYLAILSRPIIQNSHPMIENRPNENNLPQLLLLCLMLLL